MRDAVIHRSATRLAATSLTFLLLSTSAALADDHSVSVNGPDAGRAPEAGVLPGIDIVLSSRMLEDHFLVEHRAELARSIGVAPEVRAEMIEEHFRLEYGAGLPAEGGIDPALQAEWLAAHLEIEYPAET
jgi:hypothetical protein